MEPTSVNKTFDTSLIDTQRSFSSTETDTSGTMTSSPKDQPTEHGNVSTSAADRTMANEALYNEWASTYDTDGNVLQAIDDMQMDEMLPTFLKSVINAKGGEAGSKLRILDLGCGTGRNTLRLMKFPWTQAVRIDAWDASQGMLDVAKTKCDRNEQPDLDLSIQLVNFADQSKLPQESLGSFHAVLSTLVLEHLPARDYFSVVAAALKPGGYALISNMHPSMGAMTRAGYKTKTGERIKGTSYVHTADGAVEAARNEGLEVVNLQAEDGSGRSVLEVAVTDDMLREGLVGPRGRKWVGVKIWFGMLLRKAR